MRKVEAKIREELFRPKNLEEFEARQKQFREKSLSSSAKETTESLAKLVAQISDQVNSYEETNTILINSSEKLKTTNTKMDSVSAHIKSGGVLLSRYIRRETTDQILITICLVRYSILGLFLPKARTNI